MEPFLKKLAAKLHADYAGKLGQLCIVFPNRRAGLFLQQYLSQMISEPVWMPQMFALEDFVIFLSGKKKSDPLTQISLLYKVYKSLPGDNKQSFSDFISWGNMLLSDFDELDQYMVEGVKAFTYLDELKIIQHWNPDGSPLTDFERKYLHFYNSLATCYAMLAQQLKEKNEGYFGLIFKQLIEDDSFLATSSWEKVVFAGFNALTPAEEYLINKYIQARKALVFWDADNYYLDDSTQEAGRFMRKYLKEKTFGELNWIGNSLLENPINIEVLGIPGNIGQAKLAGELSRQHMQLHGNVNGLALVLVDEGMLLPVLNSIPDEVGDFNVTMGFPIKQTPLYFLITSLISLFVNAIKNKQISEQGGDTVLVFRYYHKDIQRIITHPYLVSWTENYHNRADELLQKSFYTRDGLNLIFESISPKLRKIYEARFPDESIEVSAIIFFIRELLVNLFDFFTQNTSSPDEKLPQAFGIDAEYLHQVLAVFEDLIPLVNDKELQIEPETLSSLFGTLIAGIKLPFYGEPLNGMQVMGMLETRLLDFPDIILISANEGMLPKKKHQNTFVPDEVRRAFGMQVYSEKNAVFAYHFYRLIQRAKNVWILYNTEGDELGGGEKSRFVTQLLHELKIKNSQAIIKESVLAQIPGKIKPSVTQVKKSESMIKRLHEMAAKGISPTTLSTYLRCNLQFYYAQVLKISEPDIIADSLDAAELGKTVHDALKSLYTDFGNGIITHDIIRVMQKSAAKYLEQSFLKENSISDLSSGRNLLIVKVAENMIRQFLKVEEEFLLQQSQQINILLLEEWLHTNVEIVDRKTGEIVNINIHGQADRIDKVGDTIRIIDYKTGSLLDKELSIEQISELAQHADPSKILQVLLYAFMYVRQNKIEEISLQSGIISLLKPSSYLQVISINKEKILTSKMLQEFELTLKGILEEIFDLNMPFSATLDIEKCKRCSFNQICNKII